MAFSYQLNTRLYIWNMECSFKLKKKNPDKNYFKNTYELCPYLRNR